MEDDACPFIPGEFELFARLSNDTVAPGDTLFHEVCLGAIDHETEPANEPVSRLTIQLSAFPTGWATVSTAVADSAFRIVHEVSVPLSWKPPEAGRRGLGARYMMEATLSRAEIRVAARPPNRLGQRVQHAEIETLIREGQHELWRIPSLFWVERLGTRP